MTLGLSIANLSKVMKLVSNSDSIILRCNQSEQNSIQIVCDSGKQDRVTEFSLNLISLDSESLGIPDTNYQSEISMISNDFTKMCRELYALSETVTFEISKGSVKFQVEGEVGSGCISINTTEESHDQN